MGWVNLDPKDVRIAELEALVEALTKQVAAQAAQIATLTAQVAALSKNSTNSSKPPSADGPGVARQKAKPKGKKRGGQPGHRGNRRALLPIEQVDHVVTLIPQKCDGCKRALVGKDAIPLRHQVVEIPAILPHVTEYQLHCLGCRACGRQTRATLPHGVTLSAFGPRLAAMLAVCTAKYRLSKRAVKEMLSDFLGVALALGSVTRVERQVSAALAAPVQGALDHVKQAPVVHADETIWRENKSKAWLWIATTPLVAVFIIAISRGKVVAKSILGEGFSGILVSDRWSAYRWVDPRRRQLCWAHLIRDFQSWVDAGGIPAKIGVELLQDVKHMFSWWHRVRDGTLTREQFQQKMTPIEISVVALLTVASECSGTKAAGMAKHILSLQDALWTFVRERDVEPTNNEGERTIRHAVMLRKVCFGTDSSDGSRFMERMLTTVATLRRQNRNVLEYVAAALLAYRTGSKAPSLTAPTHARAA